MKKIIEITFLIYLFTLICVSAIAQSNTLYTYQHLSGFSYSKEKDSVKKNWECPELYKDKSTQRKFKEIWNARTDFFTNSIEANSYIKDDDIYNYVYQIILDIAAANPQLIKKIPLLIIDRSATANAYSLGSNVIIVNTGMIAFARSREELSLVIAHELSHDILKHTERAMQEQSVLLTSEEYKKSLEEVLNSRYERLTRLKKIIRDYTFSRNRHNRYHESDADSLAIILLKNSRIAFDPVFFLRLDSTDTQYKQELNRGVKEYFLSYKLPAEDSWFVKRSKGLSSRNYNFTDTAIVADSLKTHPDCMARYEKTKEWATSTGVFTIIPSMIHEKANKILIWNLFNDFAMTECMYRILLEKDKGNNDPWYDFMVYNVLAGIYYANLSLSRFNAIGIKPKEYISKSYYGLQNMLEQVPAGQLELMYQNLSNHEFWAQLPADAQQLKAFFTVINLNENQPDKRKEIAAKEFIKSYPTSMYCEFANHFIK